MPEHIYIYICAGCGKGIEGNALRYTLDSVYFHPKADKMAEFAEKNKRIGKLRQGQPIPQDCLEQDVKDDCVMAYMLKRHAIAYNSENFNVVRL